jgi:hypothetical protein
LTELDDFNSASENLDSSSDDHHPGTDGDELFEETEPIPCAPLQVAPVEDYASKYDRYERYAENHEEYRNLQNELAIARPKQRTALTQALEQKKLDLIEQAMVLDEMRENNIHELKFKSAKIKTVEQFAPATNVITNATDTASQAYESDESDSTKSIALLASIGAQLAADARQEPRSYNEALRSPDARHWQEAIQDELQALKQKGVYEITQCPLNRTPIPCKWVFAIKRDNTGKVKRYRARLVAGGHRQQAGIDYNATFSPVVNTTTRRLLLNLAVQWGLHLRHIDVKTAFLNGDLEETIYMRPPPGSTSSANSGVVWKLRKSLYGLKQAGRQWNLKLIGVLKGMGFQKSKGDDSLFYRITPSQSTFLAIYVDDILIATSDPHALDRYVSKLSTFFDITDLAYPSQFLGMEINPSPTGIRITQSRYVHQIQQLVPINLKPRPIPMSTNLKLLKVTSPGPEQAEYRSLVGSAMFAATQTRPDIAFAMSVLTQHLQAPTTEHMQALRYLVGYLKQTQHYGIDLRSDTPHELVGYADASYNQDPNTNRSTTGYIFLLNGSPVSWASKLQRTASGGGTAEAEFTSLSSAVKETIFIRDLLEELGHPCKGPTKLYCDNKSAVAIANGGGSHSGTKHYRNRIAFVRDHIAEGNVQVVYKGNEGMLADFLTKALPEKPLNDQLKSIGMFLDK